MSLSFDGELWTATVAGESASYMLRDDAARYERERLAGRTHEQAIVVTAEAWWREAK